MASRELSKISPDERRIVDSFLQRKPVPLGALAAGLGVEVRLSALRPGESGSIELENGRFVIKVNRHETRERQRFTLAHEIAHYLLHKNLILSDGKISDTVLYRSGQPERIEFEANRLAADLIMPDELIKADLSKIGPSITEEAIEYLAHEWQVSRAAMEIKLGPVAA
jgi:hypothetical protein